MQKGQRTPYTSADLPLKSVSRGKLVYTGSPRKEEGTCVVCKAVCGTVRKRIVKLQRTPFTHVVLPCRWKGPGRRPDRAGCSRLPPRAPYAGTWTCDPATPSSWERRLRGGTRASGRRRGGTAHAKTWRRWTNASAPVQARRLGGDRALRICDSTQRNIDLPVKANAVRLNQ